MDQFIHSHATACAVLYLASCAVFYGLGVLDGQKQAFRRMSSHLRQWQEASRN